MTEKIPTLVVKTKHSTYVIDQTAGRYSRTRNHENANVVGYGVGNDGEWRQYEKIASSLEPGNGLVIIHGDGSWVRSTAIESVTEQ